ncbi:MAG: zinc ribbon domain-containing protein [Anaerolineae bacterium]
MDVAAITLGIIVTGAMAVFIAWPWWKQERDAQAEAGAKAGPAGMDRSDSLVRQREAVLTALRDLDFDHATGKVVEADYGPLRQAMLAQAAGILAELDKAQAAAEAELDAGIEAEALAVRAGLAPNGDGRPPAPDQACPACGWSIRPGALYCAGCGTKLGPICPGCGHSVQSADTFCAGCGLELTPV